MASRGVRSSAGRSGASREASCCDAVRLSFRRLDSAGYPEVACYSRDEIYGNGDNMAPGGLRLTARMARSMNLTEGDIVLDIGCGRGDSSIFLARRFGAIVVCFDRWISSTFLCQKIATKGYRHAVFPLDLDAAEDLPFPDDYFDAVFCMQALHTFGASSDVLRRLIRHLKPGGRFVVGGSCFNEEMPDGALPEIYQRTDDWDAEYGNYHSPPWWKAAFEATRLAEAVACDELPDGLIMWEDEVLYHGERAGWTEEWYRKAEWLIDQLMFSRNNSPYLTHFILAAQKTRRLGPAKSHP